MPPHRRLMPLSCDLFMDSNRITIRIKRVYEEPDEADGRRILVDRLWPRGLSKDKARIDVWVKEIAPSTGLRQWYGHDPKKWDGFVSRYTSELDAKPGVVGELLAELHPGTITFLYGTREEELNNAVALRKYIEAIIRTDAL